MPAPTTIEIEGRTYTVELIEDTLDKDRQGYQLTGKRGARYFTMRNVPNPHLMFLVNLSATNAPKSWLTDEGGTLRVAGR